MQTGERVIYEECGTNPEFKGALTAFVCRIIDNITKEALREQKKNALIREIEESDLTAEIEDFKTEREVGLLLFENKALVSAVLSLTEKQQKVIDLYYFKQMRSREIARELNMSDQSVSNLLKRAIETLQLQKKDIARELEGGYENST